MLKQTIENLLENYSWFRERKNKNRGLVDILVSRNGLQDVPKDKLIAFVSDYASADRLWRQILEKRPELRGSDYYNKTELEEKKKTELGYRGQEFITKTHPETNQKTLL